MWICHKRFFFVLFFQILECLWFLNLSYVPETLWCNNNLWSKLKCRLDCVCVFKATEQTRLCYTFFSEVYIAHLKKIAMFQVWIPNTSWCIHAAAPLQKKKGLTQNTSQRSENRVQSGDTLWRHMSALHSRLTKTKKNLFLEVMKTSK